MGKPNGRRVRLEQFRQQLEEAVLPPDGVVKVDLPGGGQVQFRVPLNAEPGDEYVAAIQATQDEDDLLTVVLGQDGADRWLSSGATASEFAVLFAVESRGASERLRDFRYRPSGS